MQRGDMDWLEKELETLSRDLELEPESREGALVVAIDQGGHASRAVAFDLSGRAVADAYATVTTRRDGPDRVEQDADEVAASIVSVLADLADSLGERATRVAACGLATQRSSIVCWDRASGAALSPVISWQDRRNADWLDSLQPQADRIRALTGLVLSPHYGASKLRWCLEHLPEVAAAARRGRLVMGPLASFLAHRLVKDRAPLVDPANASRTQLWDPTTRTWSSELLELFGIPLACLPDTVPSRSDYGRIRFGDREVPLRVCTGDQCAAAFAHGWPTADAVKFNVGTGGFLLCTFEESPPADARLLRSVLWADEDRVLLALEGTINGAGSALDWLAGHIGLDPHRAARALTRSRVDELDIPLFLNAVSGLGSPYWLAQAQSGFVGGGDELAQVAAVIESIAFLARANVDEMRSIRPALARIEVTGGLAAADYLCQALADVTGLPVARLATPEATACGLAYLTAFEPTSWQPDTTTTTFDPTTNPALLERYVRWQHGMQKLVPLRATR
ncbi:MAG TPA: FGGY family carbohydrate kinase [Steroidobacteraceae bacterium]|nr:FGGY family carbohydrate kinase [Steroidobacteraceae bacterium]